MALLAASSTASAQFDDRCARTEACKEAGRCTSRGDECVVGSDGDCRSAVVCTKKGRCTLVDDACAATSIDECRNSANCRDEGDCYFDREEGRCDDSHEPNKPLLYSGVAVASLGGLAVVAGGIVLVLAVPYCGLMGPDDGEGSCPGYLIAGATIGAGVGVALIAGLPMIIVGAEGDPREAPTVVVGPAGARLEWQF